MNPPGYQAPVMKASRCGNERQEMSDRRKAGRKGSGKNKHYHLDGIQTKLIEPRFDLVQSSMDQILKTYFV